MTSQKRTPHSGSLLPLFNKHFYQTLMYSEDSEY